MKLALSPTVVVVAAIRLSPPWHDSRRSAARRVLVKVLWLRFIVVVVVVDSLDFVSLSGQLDSEVLVFVERTTPVRARASTTPRLGRGRVALPSATHGDTFLD